VILAIRAVITAVGDNHAAEVVVTVGLNVWLLVKLEAAPNARADAQLQSVVVRRDVAEVGRRRDDVVGLAKKERIDVIQIGNRLVMAPCSVSRSCVQLSCAEKALYRTRDSYWNGSRFCVIRFAIPLLNRYVTLAGVMFSRLSTWNAPW
jgi:hypothetical protein